MSLLGLLGLLIQSCGLSGDVTVESKIDRFVSDDADFVVCGNVKRWLEEMDIKHSKGKLMLPPYLTEVLEAVNPFIAEEFEDGLDSATGLDYTNVVMAGTAGARGVSMILSFNIDDKDDFYSTVSNVLPFAERSSEQGFTLIGNGFFSFVIDKNAAYLVMRNNSVLAGRKAVAELEKWFEKAKEHPLKGWKRDYLLRESVVNAWIGSSVLKEMQRDSFGELADGLEAIPGVKFRNISLGILLNLDGPAVNGNVTVFNGDKPMISPIGGKIDAGLLRYTRPNDVLVVAGALNPLAISLLKMKVSNSFKSQIEYYKSQIESEPVVVVVDSETDTVEDYYDNSPGTDWAKNKLAEYESLTAIINSVATAVEGAVQISFGFDRDVDVSDLKFNPEEYLRITAVMKCKPAKANPLIKKLAALFEQENLVVQEFGNGFKVTDPSDSFSLYIDSDEDNILISNVPGIPEGDKAFDASIFKDSWLAGELVLVPDMAIMEDEDIPYGLTVTASAKEMSFDFEMRLTDTKENVVPALVGMIYEKLGF